MSEQLHAAKNGPKELLLLPGVGHLDALDRGAPGYRERIVGFLEKGY
jgi:pimeloyl-ACP methyl ester carboxylesterase